MAWSRKGFNSPRVHSVKRDFFAFDTVVVFDATPSLFPGARGSVVEHCIRIAETRVRFSMGPHFASDF